MTGQIAAALPMVVAAFKDRYQGQLEPECLAIVDRLPAAVVAMQGVTDFPITLQHADFRLDNILFDVKGGARRMGTLDWQTITLGPALTDVSYFLSAGLSPERAVTMSGTWSRSITPSFSSAACATIPSKPHGGTIDASQSTAF